MCCPSKVRVWDTVGGEQILKGEYKVISGKMCVIFCRIDFWLVAYDSLSNDLEWDGESKRIIAVGDGREKSVLIVLQLLKRIKVNNKPDSDMHS
jgi:hypothetical protein